MHAGHNVERNVSIPGGGGGVSYNDVTEKLPGGRLVCKPHLDVGLRYMFVDLTMMACMHAIL